MFIESSVLNMDFRFTFVIKFFIIFIKYIVMVGGGGYYGESNTV